MAFLSPHIFCAKSPRVLEMAKELVGRLRASLSPLRGLAAGGLFHLRALAEAPVPFGRARAHDQVDGSHVTTLSRFVMTRCAASCR